LRFRLAQAVDRWVVYSLDYYTPPDAKDPYPSVRVS
jgi:hypothetical protein